MANPCYQIIAAHHFNQSGILDLIGEPNRLGVVQECLFKTAIDTASLIKGKQPIPDHKDCSGENQTRIRLIADPILKSFESLRNVA